MLLWGVILIWQAFFKFNWASLSFDVDDDFRDCGNGLPFPTLDFSNFQIIQEADGSMTLNGSIQFTDDMESPSRFRLYSRKLERGEWVPGLFNRDVPNMCPLLQMPHELWYPFTRILQQKSCPYKAGHIEHFKSVNIGNYAKILNLPPSFIGEWRVYYEFTTTRRRKRVQQCMLLPITVSELYNLKFLMNL